ncbi:MAG: efflux RND transporter periplasmic adaptor subunit [Candidatus Aminicenantia bacterium]
MIKKNKKILLLIATFAFFLISCKSDSKKISEKGDSLTEASFPVSIARVEKRTISKILSFTGNIEPLEKATIVPDISGKLWKIYVDVGQKVSKGQILAELDHRHIDLQLEQAKAGFEVARANLKDAETNYQRMEKLYRENAISSQQFEKVKLAYEAARSQFQQAQAALNLAKYQQEVSIMKAPFDGMVVERLAEEGDVVNPMMGGLGSRGGVLVVMNFSKVKVDLDVSERDVLSIKKGQVAYLEVPPIPEKRFKGTVTIVNLVADPATKTFKVRTKFENPDLLLKPGTFGKVTIEIETKKDALAIKKEGLVESAVFVVESGKAFKRIVKTGIFNSTHVEIVEGLKEGEIYVLEGNLGLKDGASVKITGGGEER